VLEKAGRGVDPPWIIAVAVQPLFGHPGVISFVHLILIVRPPFNSGHKRIFEIGPVTFLNPQTETGVNEYRHLAFGITGPDAGYAGGRAVLDAVLRELGLNGEYRPLEHPSFIEGRCAEVTIGTDLWARLGEIHPHVLNNFGLAYPVVYCELRLARVF